MTEAFGKIYGQEKIKAFSCGLTPSGIVNPKAIESMRTVDYNLSESIAKLTSLNY